MKSTITLLLLVIPFLYLKAEPDFGPQLDKLVKESADADAFSGNVLIGKDGKVVYKNFCGFADWEKKISLNDSTIFNVGSIGKDFTQVVMIQLASEKKLNFDDPLSNYLHLFNNAADTKITLRMLLTMQSGLGDYHERPFSNLQERMDYIKTKPLLFDPGTSREYSNSGYVVLAAIIEKVTGKPFDQNVKERIFSPLSMSHSQFVFPETKVSNKASGTEIKPNGDKVTEHEINDKLTPSGDGAEYSSASDLLKFYTDLLNGNTILTDEEKEIFFSRFESKPAHTLKEMKANTKVVLGYAGGLNGWNACVDIYFGLTYVVVSVSNFSDADQPAEELNHRIHQVIADGKYDAPRKPRFVFAYTKLKELHAQQFVIKINQLLKDNGYEEIQGPYFFNQIAQQLYRENNFDDAIALLQQNTKLFPQAPMTWLWIGKSYLKQGKKVEAKAALTKCLDLDPENEEAKTMLDKI